MRLHFQEVGARDVERLAEWLPAHSWPYHRLQRVDGFGSMPPRGTSSARA
jgi:hypothetical protein